ncbi:MAG: hypothetical protein HUU28_17565, partial [Planctomycetaceae bacterium]|nr:hypothetical protein [Planctomycetaceae bacterium]
MERGPTGGVGLRLPGARIPLLDGALVLRDLALGWSVAGWEGSAGAVLEPVSMPLLTEALGLPRMAGVMSAALPGLHLRPGELVLDGTLAVSVFGGWVQASGLRVLEPFGVASHLTGEIEARHIDLAQLTEAFSFGSITGHIDADVRGLELSSWRPTAFDAWFRDHFGLRPAWIRLNNRVSIEAFGVSPTSEIVLGPDAWMFTTRDRAVDVWRGADPFSAEELELWGKVLADRREWCAQRGVKYLFAIAPNKESIYPEFFPARFDKLGPSRREQLVQHVGRRTEFPLLDLTEPILAEKALAQPGEQLYYRLGTHWNDRGAVPAARALLERLRRELPQLAAPAREAFTFVPTEFQDDSWAGRLYMEDVLRQPNADASWSRAIPAAAWERLRQFLERRDKTPEERVRFAIRPEPGEGSGWAIDVLDSMNVDVVREGVAAPRAVVFHDSMGEKLRPLLAEAFSRVAFRWVPDFDTNVIEREQPDVVLQVFVERALAAVSLSTSPLDTQEVLETEFRASSTTLLVGLGQLTLPAGAKSRISQHGEDGLTLEYGGTALELPPLVVPPGTWPVLRIELDSPVDTALCLEFLTGR